MRSFGRHAAALAAVLIATGPYGTASGQTVELKVSHYVPPNHTVHRELTRWAEDLDRRSNGRLKLTVFPAGQMGPVPRQYDLARTGVADIAYVLHGALPGRFALTEVAQLPYVFSRAGGDGAQAVSTAEASAILTDLAPTLAKEHEGTKPLYLIATPTVSLFFNKATVRAPGDMKGLRLRHNGPISAATIEAWGGVPAAIPPAELADALAKGTINGMAFNYEAAQSFQVAEGVKTVTPVTALAATFALVMNRAKYDALPDDLRRLIDETTGPAAARRVGAALDEAEAEGRKYLLAHNVQILDLSVEQRAAFESATKPVVDRIVAGLDEKGLPGRQVLDQIRSRVEQVKASQ